jgi:hypothetical protein
MKANAVSTFIQGGRGDHHVWATESKIGRKTGRVLLSGDRRLSSSSTAYFCTRPPTDGQGYPNVMMEHAYASVNSRYLAPSKTQEPGHTVRGLPTPSRLFFRGKMLLVSCSQNALLQRRSVLHIATHFVCPYSLLKR